jgi:hypothetical protein
MAFNREKVTIFNEQIKTGILDTNYITTDTIATVKGANYFNYSISNEDAIKWKVGSTIRIVASDNVEFAIVKTVTIAGDTATVVINTTVNA